MVTMDDISNAIILLVRVGAVARFIYCLVRLTAAEEQAAQYKKRAPQHGDLLHHRNIRSGQDQD